MLRQKKKILIYKIKSGIRVIYSAIFNLLFKFKNYENKNLLERKLFSYKFYLFHQKLKTFFRLQKLKDSYDNHLKKFENEFKNIEYLEVKKILCIAA